MVFAVLKNKACLDLLSGKGQSRHEHDACDDWNGRLEKYGEAVGAAGSLAWHGDTVVLAEVYHWSLNLMRCIEVFLHTLSASH